MGKYLDQEKNKDLWISFRLLDKDRKLVKDFNRAGCYSSITYNMDAKTAIINPYRLRSVMPYNVPEILRWIADLNEMGFPCEFEYTDSGLSDEEKQVNWAKETIGCSVPATPNDDADLQSMALMAIRHGGPAPIDPTQFYNFYVHLKNYVNKSHLFSTLSLIRCLHEPGISVIPEAYFEKLDADPTLNKFQLLQNCHKTLHSGGHVVTYSSLKNVDHGTIMKRFQDKTDLFTGRLAVNQAWSGI